MIRIPAIASIAFFLALTACGGGSSSSDNSADNTAAANAAASPAATDGGGMTGTMGSSGSPAAIPAGLNCGAVQPVWVNLNTKAYHEPGDRFYGKTKHGEYLCPSVAKKDGYHPAGGAMGGSMSAHHKKGDSSSQ